MRTKQSERPQRAGIYVRLSKWEPATADVESSAVTRQEPDGRELCDRRGFEVAEVYVDEDRSAFTGARRPAYERLLDDVKNGRLDVVVVQHPDRLHRHPRELEDFVELLEQTGTTVVTCTAGDVDLETPEGRLMARITGAVARKESEDKSRRLRRMMNALVTEGRPNGGPRPYGWRRIGARTPEGDTRALVPEPAEAAVVAEMTERVARGESLTAVARDLNARGLTTRAGSRWNLTNVRQVVLNGTNAGLRFHNGREVGRAAWADHAIVDEATWRRAHRILTHPERATLNRRTARRYLLTGGLLRCGRCGGPLYSKPLHGPHGSVAAYACSPSTDTHHPGCGGVTVRAEPVEELIANAVIDRVESKRFAQALGRREGHDADAAAEAAAIEAELAHLARELSLGAMTLGEWQALRPGYEARLNAARARIATDTSAAAVGPYAGRPDELRREWERRAGDLDWRQAVVRSVLDHVVIASVGRQGNRFDPRRVGEPVWRA